MRSSRRVRVLMLGWEYPPRFAGGLGKACRGLSQAMARQGAQVFFVLPTFPERISEPRLEVVGVWECLIESGWTKKTFRELQRGRQPGPRPQNVPAWMEIRTTASLFPYGEAPEGPVTE